MANKHCKKFAEHDDYIDAMNSNKLSIHTVSYCKAEKDFHYDNDMYQVECVFYVTDITQRTKILSNTNNVNLIEIDGVKIDNVTQFYQFDSTGYHIIRYSINTIPTLTQIFVELKNLISFKCNNSISSILTGTFRRSGLNNVNITKDITYIDSDVNIGSPFSECYLNDITVDPDNPVYDSRDNCNAVIETSTNTVIVGGKNTVIPNTVTTIGYFALCWSQPLSTFVIPDSVTTLKRGAFIHAPLQHINIPASVVNFEATSSNEFTFNNTALISVTIDPGNLVYDSRDNCNAVIESSTNTLIIGGKNTVIPNTVTTINCTAFRNPEITSITIPESVTQIYIERDQSPFNNCTGLETVIFRSVTPPNIRSLGNSTLFSLVSTPNLTNIYVPDESIELYKTALTPSSPDFIIYIKGISTMP